MKIQLTMTGTMKKFLSIDRIELVLKENATLADLYDELSKVAEETTPSAIWNREKNVFAAPSSCGPAPLSSKMKIPACMMGKKLNSKDF